MGRKIFHCLDDTLTDFLMENYEVDSETAKRDAEQLIKNWLEAGIIK